MDAAPYSDEAERGLIEAIAADPLVAMRCRVPVEDFWRPTHRALYSAILGLVDEGQPVDVPTLCDALATSGDLDRVGGVPGIADILTGHGLVVHAEQCAAIVERKARDRRLLAAYQAGIGAIIRGGDATAEERAVRDALEPTSTDVIEPSDVGRRFRADYRSGEFPFLPVPLEKWTTAGGGLALSCQTVIGARPSSGKTALAINIAYNLAKNGHPVLFLSLEMTPAEIHRRLVALHSWDKGRQRNEAVTLTGMRYHDADTDLVCSWSRNLDAMPLYVESRIRNLARLEAKARRMIYSHGIQCVILDYVGKVQDPTARGDNIERVSIGNTSATFFRIAKETGAATVLLSQLNREAEGVMEPTLRHLRASGDMEQDADVVILLARKTKDEPWGNFCIRKQRDGTADAFFKFAFLGAHMAITDYTDRKETP